MKRLWLLLLWGLVAHAQPPQLMLLETYTQERNISGWVMSEKLDGVRAYWDGKQLISRSGHTYAAPATFTQDFPPFALDGELWSKRGDFERIASITNQLAPHKLWHELTYRIFDVPQAEGNLTQRLAHLRGYLSAHPNTTLRIIEQHPVDTPETLRHFFEAVQRQGGEGVVVRDPSSAYTGGRSERILKLKAFEDAECTITGYTKGKGKYEGQIGALVCRMEDGRVLRIGSGLSDGIRAAPPSTGTRITFKYYGLTAKGNPRHPVFLRVRDER